MCLIQTAAKLVVASAILCLSTAGLPQDGADLSARNVLLKSLENHRKQTVELLQNWRPFSEDRTVTVKVVNVANKKMRVDILSPLVYEGTVTIDDGKLLKTYYTDRKEVLVQASPIKFETPPEKRIKLIESNYKLNVKSGVQVAARNTYMITLTPKEAALGRRVMLIDRKTFIPLRITAYEPGNEVRMLTDTISIKDESLNPPPDFAIPGESKYRKTSSWGPEELKDTAKAAQKLGFEPRIPTKLPHGFQIVAKHLLGTPDRPFLGVRISDGIYSATVYQWSPKVQQGKNPVQHASMYQDPYGVQYTVYGETPDGLARTLLAMFAFRGT